MSPLWMIWFPNTAEIRDLKTNQEFQRGGTSDHLDCGALSPLSPAAEPLSFLLSISPSAIVAVACYPTGKTKTAPPKGESGSATGESCDESQHSKLAASPLFKNARVSRDGQECPAYEPLT